MNKIYGMTEEDKINIKKQFRNCFELIQ